MHYRISLALNLILAVGLIGSYYLHFSTSKKLTYIKTNQLLTQYQGMKDAVTELQQKSAVWKANVDSLQVEFQSSVEKYQKESVKMTSNEKKLSEELIENKRKQLMHYQQGIQQKIQEEDQKLTQEVLSQVNAYIEEYGKQHNYEIILAATDMGNVVYASDGIDVTQEVLTGLNNAYKGR